MQEFAFSITPAVQETIQEPSDPVGLQYYPTDAEKTILPHELVDPIQDDQYTPVAGVVHRHPNRCLLKIANVCPVYCRFCFRKTMIGPGSKALGSKDREGAYQYIREHSEIWEVILTGGDPLILNPNLLASVMKTLDDIDHVKVVRIHTRVPVTDPDRINHQLLQVLKIRKPVYIVLHANHVNEFSARAKAAIARFIDAGFPMLSQSVLLKNINDNIDALTHLMQAFVINRVKPYYIHQLDPAPGTHHFYVSIAKGKTLMKQLKEKTSGICQPAYVVDLVDGIGKTQL